MTVKDLLKEAGSGEMPSVIDVTTRETGRVTCIKSNDNYRGCEVKFPLKNWNVWYHDSEEKDKRSRYMRDLVFITDQPITKTP